MDPLTEQLARVMSDEDELTWSGQFKRSGGLTVLGELSGQLKRSGGLIGVGELSGQESYHFASDFQEAFVD